MSLDSRYVAPGVPIISDAFLENAPRAWVQDVRESPNKEPLMKGENPDLALMVYHFTKALDSVLTDRIRRDFTGACNFGRACTTSLTHNSLVRAEAVELTPSGLPFISRNRAVIIGKQITKNSRYPSSLPNYFGDFEIPMLTRLNPGLKVICVDLFYQRHLSPEKTSFLTESLSGAIMAYELLAKQDAVYRLEDGFRLD